MVEASVGIGDRTYRELTSEEQIVLGTAWLEGAVSNQRLQQMLELHPTDIGKVLAGLVEKDMLVSDSKGRWTSYTVNNAYIKPDEQQVLSDLGDDARLLNKTDKVIYQYILENGFITAKQVIAITKISTPSGANVALKRLIGKGLVVMRGLSHNVHYVLAKDK